MSDKKIILCADDFGLHAEVSQGILQLVKKQRLSAVSCLVNGPDFSLQAQALRALKDQVQVGLHFNLTEGFSLSEPDRGMWGLKELLLKSHCYGISSDWVAKEWQAQLNCFVDNMGSLPDFIDGHQHVHQFPVIRQQMLTLYEKRLRAQGTWVRSTYPALTLSPYAMKGRVLALAGGKALSRLLQKARIPHPAYFSGVYDFDPSSNYRALFKQWLGLLPSNTNTLIMCHPGQPSLDEDELGATRLKEWTYFFSEDFVRDKEEQGVSLATGPKPR